MKGCESFSFILIRVEYEIITFAMPFFAIASGNESVEFFGNFFLTSAQFDFTRSTSELKMKYWNGIGKCGDFVKIFT